MTQLLYAFYTTAKLFNPMYRCKKLFAPLGYLALIMSFWLLGQSTAHATHAMGSDLAWTCIGPNQYRVSLTIYRDCNGVNLGNSATVNINRCGSNSTLTVTRQTGYPQDITPLCSSVNSRCAGGAQGSPGVETHLYTGVVTFPAGCNNIVLSYSLCCRNNAITTLNNPGSQNMYVEGTLNNTLSTCDNSPVFLNSPTAFLCAGQQVYYNHGGYDPDGDSLRYSMINCRRGAGQSVTYNAPRSGTNPLNTVSGINFDPATGAMIFTPNGAQVGVLCVLVEEFRNGVKIGETVRDLQFQVLNCTNILPVITGVNGQVGNGTIDYSVNSCAGNQLCFNVTGSDANATQSVFMYWNQAIPGATFTQGPGTNPRTGTFCWTPTLAQVGQHTFTISIQDNACPLLGVNTFTYTLNITNNPNPPIVASNDTTICRGRSTPLTSTTTANPANIDSIVWSPAIGLSCTRCQNTVATPTATTVYTVTMYHPNNCVSRDYVRVTVNDNPLVAITPKNVNVCPGSTVTLTGATDKVGMNFQWFQGATALGTGTVSGTQSTINVNIPNFNDTTFVYTLAVTNPTTGCVTIDTARLTVGPPRGLVDCINIYVTPTGSSAAAGTQVDPTNIQTALRRASCNNTVIKMAIGTYNIDTTLQITSFLTIEGGFNPALLWEKTSAMGATTIVRSNANPAGFINQYHMMAFNANNATGFRLQDLTIRTANADSLGMSTYGIRMEGCSNYNIVRCQVIAGNARAGRNGVQSSTISMAGTNGVNGVNGVGGITPVAGGGGNGGDGASTLGFGMGIGGTGATSPAVGFAGSTANNSTRFGGGGGGGGAGSLAGAGDNATRGGGAGGGGIPPGVGGIPAGSQTAGVCGGNGAGGNAGAPGNNNGSAGTPGITGANGASAPTGAAPVLGSFFTPGTQALSGQDGIGGTGGCGGGGASSVAPNAGGGGGGGGGGGEGGIAGTGAFGGGGSFGIYLFNNGAGGNIKDCNVTSGTAGAGGTGGLGRAGGAGGTGGTGGASSGGGTVGGNGGNGGAGGAGGNGGNGTAGVAMRIARIGGSGLTNMDSTFNLSAQPVILVENVNCTKADVDFTNTVAPVGPATTSWDFDLFTNFAIPGTATSNPATTQYDSVRRYTIVNAGQTYTDFHNIAFSKAFKPTILSNANVIGNDTFQLCVGDFATFASDRYADTLVWNFNGAIPNPGNVQNVPSSQFNVAGFYQITLMLITDCCGDSPLDTAYLFVDPRPSATAAVPNQTTCRGGSLTLTINGLNPTDSVVWSPMTDLTVTSASTAVVQPNVTTTYFANVYSVVTAGGLTRVTCPRTLTFNANINPRPIPNLSSTAVVCVNDGTATSTPTGPGTFNFVWSNGVTHLAQTTSTINALAQGNYCVTITNTATGCDTSACVFVNPAAALITITLDSFRNVRCNGQNNGYLDVNASNGTGPYTYLWNDAATGDVRTNLAPGNYCVTATDALGCNSNICYSIGQPDPLVVNVISAVNAVCSYTSNGSIQVEATGGTGSMAYQWNLVPATTPTITGLAGAATYIVTVTDANACTATASIPIAVDFPVTPSITQTAAIVCNGASTAQMQIGATNNIGPYSITINGPVNQTLVQGAGASPPVTFTNLPAGNYTVTITDQNAGCFAASNFVIAQPPVLNGSAVVNNHVTCNGGANGSATASASGGTPGYAFTWSNSSTSPTATGLAAGVHFVTISDASSCITVTSVTITQPTAVTATATVATPYNGQQISCFGLSNGSATIATSGGVGPYTFIWSNGQTTATATGLAAGTFCATVADASLCAQQVCVTVTQPSAVVSSISSSTSVTCFGAATGSATAAAVGGTPGYIFTWSTPSTGATSNGLAAGTYTVSATDLNGCRSVSSVTITQPASAVSASTVLTTPVTCNGLTNASATVSGAGGTPGYTFQWNAAANNQTTATATGLGAGTFCATVTDARGCLASSCITITQPTTVTATISSSTTVSCFGGSNGTATAAGSGGTAPYTFLWSVAAQTTATATGLNAGTTHRVTITDVNNCQAIATVTVAQPSSAHSVTANVVSNVRCNGQSNGVVSATPAGGTPGYTYMWSTGATTSSVSFLAAGSYTVTTTDLNGCTATIASALTVTQPATLVASISSSVSVTCFGAATGSATVAGAGGTGAYTFNWSNGATTATANNLVAGIYNATVTDANLCTAVTAVTITQPASAVSASTVLTTPVTCNGLTNASATVSGAGGTPGYTFQWGAGANNQTTATATGLGAGTYCATVTDARGCVASSCITITQPTTVTATISSTSTITCFGGTGTATAAGSGGTPGYTFLWSVAGQTTATASFVTAGTHTVTVSDINGCQAVASVTMTQPSSSHTVTATVVSNVRCNGQSNGIVSATPTGGTPGYTYMWSTGATTSSVSFLPAGSYTVTTTDANGCTATIAAALTVTQPTSVAASISSSTSVTCFGAATGSATAAGSGGTPVYTFLWSNGSTNATRGGLAAGVYPVTVTDANQCAAVTSVTITQPANGVLVTTAFATTITCNGATNASSTATASGGTPGYTFQWNAAANNQTTATATGLGAGVYCVIGTDANGCTASACTTVTQPSAVTATISSSTSVTCFGAATGAATAAGSGGTPGYTFLWAVTAASQTTATATGLVAGTHRVTVTDNNGCAAVATVTITQPASAHSVSASVVSNALCNGAANGVASSTPSGGTPSYTILWSTGATTSTVSFLPAGTYTVTTTDANGCTATTAAITITQPSSVGASISSQTNVACFGGSTGSATAAGSGGTGPSYTFLWSTGATTATVTNQPAGTIFVTVTDANGCQATTNAVITQPASAVAVAVASRTDVSCNGGNNGSVTITSSGGTGAHTYLWSVGNTTTTVTSLSAGVYTVTVTDASSCTVVGSVTITQPSAVTASISSTTNVSCFGGNNGTATAAGAGGTPGYTFLWANGQTTATATGLAAGAHNVTVSDANNCSNVTTANIVQPSLALSVTTNLLVPVSCNGANNAVAQAVGSGGSGTIRYLWSTGATTANASGLAAGTYCVTVTDSLSCVATSCITITQPTAVAINVLNVINVACFGQANGEATISASGGTAPYAFSWSNGNTTNNPVGLVAGTYCVTATDASNCIATACVTITQPATGVSANATVTSNFNGFNVSCFGASDGTAIANAAGGTAPYTYLWDITSQTTQTATGMAAGTYCVIVSDVNNCRDTACTTLTQPTQVQVNIVSTAHVACRGQATGSATAQGAGGVGGYAYAWSNGQSTATATGLAAGIYSVTTTDINGCNNNNTVVINEPASAVSANAVVNTDVSCNGGSNGSATVSGAGGTAPYTFLWDAAAFGQITATATGLRAGTYCATVTDANGCRAAACVTISEPSVVVASISSVNNVLCRGQATGSATAAGSGGTGPYTFVWANGQTTATATGLAAGSYNVTVLDTRLCSSVAAATVTEPAGAVNVTIAATSNYNGQNISCFGANDGQLTATGIDGTPAYNFVWSNGQTTNAAMTSVATGLVAGSYQVTATDVNGCVSSASFVLAQPNAVTATIASQQSVSCFGGADGRATAAGAGGTPGYTFLWDAAAANQTTATATGLIAGAYCVTVSDANGCSNVTCVAITQPATAVDAILASSTNPSCNGGSNGTATVSTSGGTAPYTYQWPASAGNSLTASATGLSAGVHCVTVTDNRGCRDVECVTITNPSAVTATIASQTNPTCNGAATGTATAAGSGGTGAGYTFLWSAGGQTTATATGLAAGSYTVTVADGNGCRVTTSVIITQPATGVVLATSSTPVSCNGGSNGTASVTAAGGSGVYTYLWSAGGQTTSSISALSAGTYCVTVSDGGCSVAACVTVTQPTEVTATIVSSSNVSCNGGADATATAAGNGGTPGYSFVWSNGQSTATATGLTVAGNPYTVTVTDANGCTAVNSVAITQPASAVAASIVVVNNVSCNGGSNGSAQASASGGSPSYTFLWSNGQANALATGLAAGAYTVTATDQAGCTGVASITITQPAVLTASIQSQTNVGCRGDSTGSVSIAAVGGTSGYTYNIGNGAVSSNVFNNLPVGNYSITVVDLNGCTTSVPVVITQPASSLNATASVTSSYNGAQVSCRNACDGTATASPTGGTAPYTYLWSLNNQTTQTASGLCGGNSYSVIVRDANGCSVTNGVTLTNPSLLTANLVSTTNVQCSGAATGTATISAAGGTGTRNFNIGAGPQASGNFTGLAAGNYVATVSDANGCTTTVPFTITGPAALVISSINVTSNYNGAHISCAGACDGAATVVASGGTGTYRFLWSNGQTTFTASGLCSNASVTVTDANNCSVSGNVNFIVPAPITLTVNNQVNIGCAGATSGSFEVVANGGTPNYSFNMGTGPQANGVYSNLAAGTYCVTVTDQNSCRAIVCVTITQGSPITLTTTVLSNNNGSAISCANSADGSAQVTASGGSAPYTYQWANGQTTSIVTGLTGGVHCVTVTDVNTCIRTACVTITGPAALDLTVIDSTNASCFGVANGSFTVQATGGTAPYIYSNDGGNIFTNIVTYNNLAGSVAGVQYCVIVRDANGCQDTVCTRIFEPTQLQGLIVQENDVTCNGGNDGSVTVTGTGGTAPYVYSFQGGAFDTTRTFVGLIASNYTIRIRDSKGCTFNLPVTIAQPSALVLTINNQVNPSCNLSCNGQIQVSASGATAPYEFSSNGGVTFQAGGSFNGLCAGTYQMTVRDAQGCLRTIAVTLNDPSPVAVNVTQTGTISCNGAADGRATAVASGGTGTFTYVWNPSGQTTAIATGLSAGVTYVVTATDANGCSVTGSISISEPSALQANVVLAQNPRCNGNSNGAITIQAVSGTGTGPYTYNIGAGNVASGVFTNLAAGNYNITVTDSRACNIVVNVVLTDPAVLSVPAATVTSNYNGAHISCNGATDGAATIPNPISGGTAPYRFLWSVAAGSQTTQSATGLGAGTFGVTVTDANGCTASTSVTLVAPAVVTASAAVTGAGCNGSAGGTITVTAGGGTAPYLYNLNGGTNQVSNVFNNLTAGTYTVNVRDANGCTRSVVATITQSAAINATATVTSNYSGFGVSCPGATNGSANVTATGGAGGFTYVWSTGATTQNVSGLAANTTYTVTVSDVSGCSVTRSVTLTQPSAINLVVVSNSPATCGGGNDGSIRVSATGGAGTYTYNNGSSTNSNGVFNNLTAGAYNVTATDVNGCTATVGVTVTEPNAITVTLNSTNVTCFGLQDGQISAVVTGGTPYPNGGFVYSWAPNGQSTQSIGNLQGNITYTVTVYDSRGCSQVASVFISQPTQLTATLQSTTNVDCNGNGNGSATISVSGGSGSYEYSINGGSTFQTATQNPIQILGLTGGTYQVVVRDSASHNCNVPITVSILENNGLIANATSVPVACVGNTNGTATVNVTGGGGSYNFVWSNGQTTQTATGLASNFQDSVFTNTPYFVTVTDGNGCSVVVGGIGVGAPDTLEITATALTNVLCFAGNDGSAEVTVTGGNSASGFSVVWSNGATTATITGLEAFNYSVVVTDARGCTDTATVAITEPTFPLVAFMHGDSVTCFGGMNGTIVIDSVTGGTPFAGGTYEYSFNQNGPFGSSAILTQGLPAGNYTVYVRDENGCMVEVDSIIISQPSDIIVRAYDDQIIRMGETVELFGTANSTRIDSSLVSWYYFDAFGTQVNVCTGSSCFEIVVNDIYSDRIMIFDLGNGCKDTASVSIKVNQTQSVFVPNAFTPNGDGNNDFFTVYGSVDVKRVQRLLVFDRWGELMFEATDFAPNDLSNGWDGTYRGKKLNPGVFVYYAEIELVNGDKTTRKGDVTLLR